MKSKPVSYTHLGQIACKARRYGFEHLCTVTPIEALFSQMNLLGSHDTKRIITKLAGAPQPQKREEQIRLTLSAAERKHGEELVLAGMLLQLAFPGAMAIYYGDELGMEGYDCLLYTSIEKNAIV